jgi:hypothetical protein
MNLDLVRVPRVIVGVRERLVRADDVGAPEEELVTVVRATQQLLQVRNRLLGYAYCGGMARPELELPSQSYKVVLGCRAASLS